MALIFARHTPTPLYIMAAPLYRLGLHCAKTVLLKDGVTTGQRIRASSLLPHQKKPWSSLQDLE